MTKLLGTVLSVLMLIYFDGVVSDLGWEEERF